MSNIPPSNPPYEFPTIALEEYLAKFRNAPKSSLVAKVLGLTPSPNKTDNYLDNRAAYCALGIHLNETGLIAPAFRPVKRLNKAKNLTAEEEILGLDRQVIDLHYLFCQHRPEIRPTDDEFKRLFSDPEFDYQLAADFAQRKWTKENKARKSLGLPEHLQYEMAVLRERRVADHMRSVLQQSAEIRVQLRDLANISTSRLDPKSIDERVEEFICLKLAEGSPKDAVRFLRLRGKLDIPESDPELRAFRERLRKHKNWMNDNLKLGKL